MQFNYGWFGHAIFKDGKVGHAIFKDGKVGHAIFKDGKVKAFCAFKDENCSVFASSRMTRWQVLAPSRTKGAVTSSR